ncbi:MAG: hypothetical protein RTU63_12175 [Candidatus Thorarchaeota archaeon]
MASVSTSMESVSLANEVSVVMTRLFETLTNNQKKKLTQWTGFIEDAAEKKVQMLIPKQLKRRNPEAVAAAAVYDAFIEFESRTQVKVGLNQMQEALGRTACSINTAWKRLFDNRVSLRGEKLGLVYTERNGTIPDAIINVIQALADAVEESTRERIKDWLAAIETEAIELSKTLMPDVTENYDTLLVAVTTIYAAIKQYPGKMLIQIGQRDLSMMSCTSPAMISKCWIEFFGI